jgi:hypothetical protein
MTRWLIARLQGIIRWLDPPPPPPAPDTLKDAARPLMAAQDASDRRGEHKRRVVLLQLRRQFPDVRTRDLAWAIESVLQERS